jgi:hypothetical protein
VRNSRPLFILCVIGLALLAAGCGHRLVAAPGQQTVSVYPDEDTYLRLAKLKKEGGMAGMLGGLGENFTAKQVDDKTPVKILSSDENGSMVEVTGGPSKGLKGFVAKNSVD